MVARQAPLRTCACAPVRKAEIALGAMQEQTPMRHAHLADADGLLLLRVADLLALHEGRAARGGRVERPVTDASPPPRNSSLGSVHKDPIDSPPHQVVQVEHVRERARHLRRMGARWCVGATDGMGMHGCRRQRPPWGTAPGWSPLAAAQ